MSVAMYFSYHTVSESIKSIISYSVTFRYVVCFIEILKQKISVATLPLGAYLYCRFDSGQ